MRIVSQVVCVDYAPQLSRVIDRWLDGVELLLVVTSSRDEATIRLCAQCERVMTLTTEVFWERGAMFNKGAAIAQGFNVLYDHNVVQRSDDLWHLFIDADALPPENWREIVEMNIDHRGGYLYGAHRCLESGVMIPEGELAGSFHLAKVTDPQMLMRPIVDAHWRHAGNYDSTFQYRWPPHARVKLPMRLTHVGEPFSNWCGVGPDAKQKMRALFGERQRRGGTWVHESVNEPTPG